MGGCATRPKVLKGGDEGDVPYPRTPREAVSAGDNNVDDESNKESRSLSDLLNKEKEKDVTTESNTPSEASKQRLGPEKPMEPGSGFPGNIGIYQAIEWAPEAGAVTVTETQSKKDKAVVEN